MDDRGGNRLGLAARLTWKLIAGMVISALIIRPYLRWFEHPSLFDDDFLRVGSLRRSTLAEALFRPFNEHMAPLFETVSWLSWQASGHLVMNLPLSFQISSYLAFASTFLFLGLVIWIELGSWVATWSGLAIFALSAVSAETVLWFSASSFEWSAAATLAAWLFASLAARTPTTRAASGWLVASVLASLAAPAFSAIGLLAGPVAGLRLLSDTRPARPIPARLMRSVVPFTGTLTYVLICQVFSYGDVVASSVQKNLDLPAAIWATLEAPAAVLILGLFGQRHLARSFPGSGLALFTIIGLVAGLRRAVCSSSRPLILGGLVLIFAGYFAAYATRARTADPSIFEVQRYHLFPQMGLSILLASALDSVVKRLKLREPLTILVPVVVTGLLAVIQFPRMQAASDRNFRYPDQPRAIAAMLQLEMTCEREGATLIQAMNAIDPVQAPWFPKRGSFHPLFHLFANGSKSPRLADEAVRSALLASLSMHDREAIFGGLDASSYQIRTHEVIAGASPVATLPAGKNRVVPTGTDRYRAGGPGSWLEFEVEPGLASGRQLVLPDLKTTREVEIWWSGSDGIWSTFRSVRWSPLSIKGDRPPGIDLERLPHWRPGFVRKIRLIFHEWGPISIGVPGFIR